MWLAIIPGCMVLAALWAWLETKHRAAVKERQARLSTALERQDDLRRWTGFQTGNVTLSGKASMGYGNDQR